MSQCSRSFVPTLVNAFVILLCVRLESVKGSGKSSTSSRCILICIKRVQRVDKEGHAMPSVVADIY